MKKTISINLGGMAFTIEEDAYTRLNSYLDSLKSHFGTSDYGQEVVNDIEARIAEQFGGRMQDRRKEVITMAEVDAAIKTMGTLDDLNADGKKDEGRTESPRGDRRLYRSPDDQILAGVCSGIANYFNIDPLIPRVLFAISTLAAGWGILLYVVLWAIIPEARNSSQKLEMKGSAVNIATLEQNRKDQGAKEPFSMARYFFREVFYLVGRFFRMLGPVIVTAVGLVMTAVAFCAVFAITLITIILAFNPDSNYIDPAIRQVFNGNEYVMMISSAFVTLIIPALVGLVMGLSLVRRRNLFSTTLAVVFGVVFLIGGVMLGLTTSRAAPQIEAAVRSMDERPEMSREFQVQSFDGVISKSNQKVKIAYGPQAKVIAYGRQRELENTTMTVSGGTLEIDFREKFRICLFCISRPVTIEIITPSLAVVDANNASQVEIRGFNASKAMRISSGDSARVSLEGKVDNLTLDIDNAGHVTASGTGKTVTAELSNAARLDARSFVAESVDIQTSNSASAEVFASKSIDASASNASHIDYHGNPAAVVVDESNAGRVTSR